MQKYKVAGKYGTPSLVIKCYEYDQNNKRREIPAYITVNHLVFEPKIENERLQDVVLNPRSGSKLDIQISFIGKETVVIKNFKLKPRDSVILDVYMMDSNEVLN